MVTVRSQRLSDLDGPPLPLTVRVKEACRLTGIGRSKLYLLMKEGDIATIKVGSLTLIPWRNLSRLHIVRLPKMNRGETAPPMIGRRRGGEPPSSFPAALGKMRPAR